MRPLTMPRVPPCRRTLRCWAMVSRASHSPAATRDYSLVGLVLLHRHGHRAPMKNCWDHPDHTMRAQEEELLWKGWLPSPDQLEALNSSYPIHSKAIKAPRDDLSAPFGCLTHKGLSDMTDMGRSLRTYYDERLGQGLSGVQVYSTNFLRTQRSAQALLTGFRAQVQPEEAAADGKVVPVVVRHEKECTIHMYDNDPQAIQEEVARLLQSPDFLKLSAENMGLQRDLARLVPGLQSTTSSSSSSSPSFKWMEAADFFWCRHASDIELSPELQALSEPTIRCLVRRFGVYYRHEPLLKLVIEPFAREVLSVLRQVKRQPSPAASSSSSSSSSSVQPPPWVSVYSGHDVTILALLYALRSPIVMADPRHEADKPWWPPYGCTLVFELLQPPGSGGEELLVRVLLAGSGLGAHPAQFVPVLEDDSAIPLAELAHRLGVN